MKTVGSSIKQAIFSKDFLWGILAVMAVVFLTSVPEAVEALREGSLLKGFHKSLMEKAIRSQAMTLALPMAAALPFAASTVQDLKSGFIKQYLPRTDRNHYLAGKCMAGGLSGGLVPVLGLLLSYVILALVFIPLADPASKEAVSGAFYAGFIKSLVLLFLSGAFWSLCGLTLATISGSKYMAYASPFIIYYVLIILHERYFDGCHVLYPKEWIRPSSRWVLGDWGVILLLLGLIAAMSALFCIAAKRRISQL